VPGGLVFLEVDEKQHISCDQTWMADAMASLFIEFKEHVYWVQYHPNTWPVNGDLVNVGLDEREGRLVHWIHECDA
jgi:hypothetical protein